MNTSTTFKKDFIRTSKLLILAIALSAGTSYIFADWSAPSALPPTCPAGSPGCDAPLNIGNATQAKSGSLFIGQSSVPSGPTAYTGLGYLEANALITGSATIGTNGLTLNGPVTLPSGIPTAGQALESSDTSGDLKWATLPSGPAGYVLTGIASWSPPVASPGSANSTDNVPNQTMDLSAGSGTYNTNIFATYFTCDDFTTSLLVDGTPVSVYGAAEATYDTRNDANTGGCDQNTIMANIKLSAGTHTLSLSRPIIDATSSESGVDGIGETHFLWEAFPSN
jgi:hypothetical protein